MLIVVRHAEAGSKGSWGGPDLHRPLSPEGHDQAEGLVVRLDDYPVERIVSSPAARCLQTVGPLARDRLLQVEEVAALGVDADAALVESRFVHSEAANAVLCTHGELIGRLFARLVPAGLAVEDPLLWPKGSAWLLWRAHRRLHARSWRRWPSTAAPTPADRSALLRWPLPAPPGRPGELAILAARSLDIVR